jgi:hypothetical protein
MAMIGLVVVNYLGCGSSSDKKEGVNSNSSKGDVNSYVPETAKKKKIYYVSENNQIEYRSDNSINRTVKTIRNYEDGFFIETKTYDIGDGQPLKEVKKEPAVNSKITKTDTGYIYQYNVTEHNAIKSVVSFSDNGTAMSEEGFVSSSIDDNGKVTKWNKQYKFNVTKDVASNLTTKYDYIDYDKDGKIKKHTIFENKISNGKIEETKYIRDGKLTMTATPKYENGLLKEIDYVVHHWFPCKSVAVSLVEPCRKDETDIKYLYSNRFLNLPVNPDKYKWTFKYDDRKNIINRHLSADGYEVDYNYEFNNNNQLIFWNRVVNGEVTSYHKYRYFSREHNVNFDLINSVIDFVSNKYGDLSYEEHQLMYFVPGKGKHIVKNVIIYRYDQNGFLAHKEMSSWENGEFQDKIVNDYKWKSAVMPYNSKPPIFSKRTMGLLHHADDPYMETFYETNGLDVSL